MHSETINKMNKTKLDQVFNLNNSDEVFSFMKDYAYKNQDLSAALIRHFLPDDIDLDSLRAEVRNIIFSVDEREHGWGPAFDWYQIDVQLGRMMEKAKYYDREGEFDAAASIASEVILFVGKHYSDDCVYECEGFDGYDFETKSAADMLISLIESKVLDTNTIRRISSDIDKASGTSTFHDGGYCIADLSELQSVLEGVFDNFDEHLASLDKIIDNAGRSVYYRNRWLLRKVAYLNYKEKYDAAQKTIDDNFFVPELSKMRIDSQIFHGQIEDAIESLDRAIECTEDSSYVHSCHERKMELLKTTGDTSRLAEELEYLFLNSYSSEYDYYLQLKHVLEQLPANSPNRLHTIIEKLVNQRRFHNQRDTARICAEENMIPQLAECLSWNNDYNDECYMVLAEYGKLLDSSTRRKIVEGYIDHIRTRAIPADSRKYCYIVSNMKALRDSCSEGQAAVNKLIEEFRIQYCRRPSMMGELNKLR